MLQSRTAHNLIGICGGCSTPEIIIWAPVTISYLISRVHLGEALLIPLNSACLLLQWKGWLVLLSKQFIFTVCDPGVACCHNNYRELICTGKIKMTIFGQASWFDFNVGKNEFTYWYAKHQQISKINQHIPLGDDKYTHIDRKGKLHPY